MNKKSILSHVGVAVIFLLLGIGLMYPIGTSKLWFVDIQETIKEKPVDVNFRVATREWNEETQSYGDWKVQETHNLVVTIGLARACNLLYGSAANPTNVTDDISLSNDDTPLAAWTKLPNEITSNGLDRNDGTESQPTTTSLQSVYTFTSTADAQTVQCAGLHWAADDGLDNTLFAAATFTQVTLNTNDQIQITWTVTLTSG